MKEKTIHTTPNILRVNNGIAVPNKEILLKRIKEHREQFDVDCNSILRLRCNCGNIVLFKNYDNIPENTLFCDKCKSIILNYTQEHDIL